jgi:hypothetical protein
MFWIKITIIKGLKLSSYMKAVIFLIIIVDINFIGAEL